MEQKKGLVFLKIINTLVFIVMVTVNAMSNALPINGLNTAAISDSYPNLFAPAGLTFAIWGLIYLLLALFVLYQWGIFKGISGYKTELIRSVSPYFIVSSLANAAWIFSWHYKVLWLSVILMAVILLSLIAAYIKINRTELTLKERFFVRLPFSVYFGWITVATIANITTFIVYLGWDGSGIQGIWTVIILAVGTVIGALTAWRFKSVAYGLVILWAYTGILIKHLTVFAGQYTEVVIAAIACLAAMAFIVIIILINRLKKPD